MRPNSNSRHPSWELEENFVQAVLLSTCPRWWQLPHSDLGIDDRVLQSVTYAVSILVTHNKVVSLKCITLSRTVSCLRLWALESCNTASNDQFPSLWKHGSKRIRPLGDCPWLWWMLQVPFSALKLLGGQPAHRSSCNLSHKGSLQNKWRKKTDGEQVYMENSWQTGGSSLFMKQNICHKQQTDLHPLFYDNHGELVLY